MGYIRQTKFKLTVLAVFLGLIEACLKVFWPNFPITELFSFQAAVIGGYLGAKTFVDRAEIKANGKSSD